MRGLGFLLPHGSSACALDDRGDQNTSRGDVVRRSETGNWQ